MNFVMLIYSQVSVWRVVAGARQMCLPVGQTYSIEMVDTFGNGWDGIGSGAGFCIADIDNAAKTMQGWVSIVAHSSFTPSLVTSGCHESHRLGYIWYQKVYRKQWSIHYQWYTISCFLFQFGHR